MKNRIIALLVGMVLLFSLSLFAQAPDTLWTKVFGNSGLVTDMGDCVQETFDSCYIVVGNTRRDNGTAVYLNKLNRNGDILWTKIYGGALNKQDEGSYVQETSDSGYIITGRAETFGGAGSLDAFLMKTDRNGDTLWLRTYGGNKYDAGRYVEQTTDGGYVIVASTQSFDTIPSSKFYLIKTDSLGDTLWTKVYNYGDASEGQQTSDGGYIMVGNTGHLYHDVYLIKTDENGDTLWTKAYGGTSGDYGHSVQQTSDGGYIVAGHTYSFGAGIPNIYLIKTDADGDSLWTNIYGGSGWEWGFSVQQTTDSGYIITGMTSSFGAGGWDVYLMKTDVSGNLIWETTYGGGMVDLGSFVCNTSDGGYIICGYTESFGASYDVYVIKTEPDVGIKETEEGIQQTDPNIWIEISPIPFTTATNLKLLKVADGQRTHLQIYDSAGRLVKSVEMETNTYQFGADLVPAIYFLKLNGKSVGKVVKVR